MSSFGYDTPFIPSRPRKKRKNRPGKAEQVDHGTALERTRQELLHGDWIHKCTQQLRDALESLSVRSPRILCLGLGSPTSSRDARAQLAFLLEACDDLTLERSHVSVYDPVFTDEDNDLLAAVKVQRLIENRSAAYELPDPTIAYMPHCDLQLYENLLRANWSRERLSRLVLIANRLSEYLDSIPTHKLKTEHPCVWRLAPLMTSTPLPPSPSHPTAFNNISIQFTRPETLSGVEDDFWEPPITETLSAARSHDCLITPT